MIQQPSEIQVPVLELLSLLGADGEHGDYVKGGKCSTVRRTLDGLRQSVSNSSHSILFRWEDQNNTSEYMETTKESLKAGEMVEAKTGQSTWFSDKFSLLSTILQSLTLST